MNKLNLHAVCGTVGGILVGVAVMTTPFNFQNGAEWSGYAGILDMLGGLFAISEAFKEHPLRCLKVPEKYRKARK